MYILRAPIEIAMHNGTDYRLRGLAVVFRHGSRNPKAILREGCSADLFTGIPMHLTREGERQVWQLGQKLKYCYSGIFSTTPTLKLHCSGLQRSVASGMVMLNSISPSSIPVVSGYSATTLPPWNSGVGICPVTIEEGDERDSLFHGCKFDPTLRKKQKQWKKEVLFQCFEGQKWAHSLLDRIYGATKLQSFHPSREIYERVGGLKSLHNMLLTSKVEGHIYCSSAGLNFSARELEFIAEISTRITLSKFPCNSEGRMWSHLATRKLRNMLASQGRSLSHGADDCVALFSGHESTIVSLCNSLLQRSFEVPMYAGVLVLEYWIPAPHLKSYDSRLKLRLLYFPDYREIPNSRLDGHYEEGIYNSPTSQELQHSLGL